MALGTLLRALVEEGLLPLPSYPFEGLSFKSMASKLRAISAPSLCQVLGNTWTECYDKNSSSSLVDKRIEQTLSSAGVDILRGLELKPSSESTKV
jgi:hypothetical protein